MEVGDYLRTKYGNIAKIIDIENDEDDNTKILIFNKEIIPYYEFTTDNCYEKDVDEYIIKSSKNIIDLIQVGDYVNGLIVEKNKYGDLYIGYVYCGGDIGRTQEPYATFIKDMEIEDIKSIVTKEQFKNMEYRIDDINE